MQSRRELSPPPELHSRSPRTASIDPQAPLQRISIELSRRCNLACAYCYSEAAPTVATGLDDGDVRALVSEAFSCGARLVSIVGGGEPLLRVSLLKDGESCIDHANALGCYCLLYTNCTLVDRAAADWLGRRDVSVVGKLNSLRASVQDSLTSVPGSSARIRRGIDCLLDSGFADPLQPRLSLETIACRANYDEMPDLWRWMRARHILPEVEIPTIHGRAQANRAWLYFSDEEAPVRYGELFTELLRIDRTEFGYEWSVHPPFPAGACRLWYTNCYVNDRGGVQPCAGVDCELGIMRIGARRDHGKPLADILRTSAFTAIRGVRSHIGEPCRSCELLDRCYGCRGAAWHATGDYFAGDPVCWRHAPHLIGEVGVGSCARH
jgi:radical SAM protein with 4Fe4S-binding SPASM domain